MSIKIINISKKYGRNVILKDISFEVKQGTTLGLTGRNGCGKTTLLSILAGTEKPSSGKIIFPAGDYKIGYLPQINPLLEDMSVYDNLKLWADDRSKLEEALRLYELNEIKNRRVSRLSGGMKRRLAIACALVNNPRLLIMDEPTAALDIVYKEIIHKEMERFKSSGGTIIMVTHEKEEMDMCDSCLTIDKGIIVY